jgi:hypothetical protein
MPKASLVNFLRTTAFEHVSANGQHRCLALTFKDGPDRFGAILKSQIDPQVDFQRISRGTVDSF